MDNLAIKLTNKYFKLIKKLLSLELNVLNFTQSELLCIHKQLQELVFDLRESSRGCAIANGSILTQYGPICDRAAPGLWRGQKPILEVVCV